MKALLISLCLITPNLLWNQGAIPKSWSTKDKSRTSTPSGLGSSALTKRLSASPRERQREKQFFALSFFRCLMTRCQYLDKVCCATKVSLERRHPAEVEASSMSSTPSPAEASVRAPTERR